MNQPRMLQPWQRTMQSPNVHHNPTRNGAHGLRTITKHFRRSLPVPVIVAAASRRYFKLQMRRPHLPVTLGPRECICPTAGTSHVMSPVHAGWFDYQITHYLTSVKLLSLWLADSVSGIDIP